MSEAARRLGPRPWCVGSTTGACATTTANPKLEAIFSWGDYRMSDFGEDCDYAVAGHPGREHPWVASRTPTMEDSAY